MIRAAFLGLSLILAPLPALAHKVVASVFPSGQVIEGEVGFSNGDMAVDTVVEVIGEDGTKLGEVVTDGDGFFTWRPTGPGPLLFRADLGAGHVAEVVMPAEEVAQVLGQALAAVTNPGPPAGASLVDDSIAPTAEAPGTTAAPQSGLSDTDKAAIAAIVRDEMRPLRREIAAYKEHHDLQTILGGIGYIFGLFGLGFYLAAQRRIAGKG
ncbi:Substrate-specific component NikM of nickel ECF transporter (plasmid) [Rhodovulum sp. P5]|uniref:cobalt ABC transporter permease n=1 Tax=Rhodovulum sp. P5 TaxID=1564506 RepID=UPI0009C1B417|nr:cobalt ABC transporter permease [Rhodovulum sp. P5]ARE42279.1 Substrate-specific component NikM of nickel ECF transporter [Rhodovulum sp. P5]